MSETRTCPFCQHENPGDAYYCEQCGKAFNSDTTIWKTVDELRHVQQPAMRASEFRHNTLYLYIAGSSNQAPIQYHGQEAVILGRQTEDTPPVNRLIDLSDYHAFSLGVSRQHAKISHAAAGYTIEDLGSSNGTLLNGNRLLPGQAYPLRAGDQVQLGELLMFVYFV
ncbi:MAG: FHA domain-containing protein [Anaerolineae bacterium]|nr:FHA domain-containing protein [Anaerolineae bacterium]